MDFIITQLSAKDFQPKLTTSAKDLKIFLCLIYWNGWKNMSSMQKSSHLGHSCLKIWLWCSWWGSKTFNVIVIDYFVISLLPPVLQLLPVTYLDKFEVVKTSPFTIFHMHKFWHNLHTHTDKRGTMILQRNHDLERNHNLERNHDLEKCFLTPFFSQVSLTY